MAFAGVGVGKTRLDAPRLDAPRLDDDIGKRSFTGVKASLLVVDDRWRYIDGSIVGLSDGDFIATRRLKGPASHNLEFLYFFLFESSFFRKNQYSKLRANSYIIFD
jgi:hypothetical protein